MSDETKHTPTPFHIEKECANAWEIIDSDGQVVCQVYTDADTIELWQAEYAEFIVRACNSHAALVDVASEALRNGTLPMAKDLADWLKRARAAIAEAEKED